MSGMTAVGTYRFVYSVTSGGQTCTDTASVVRNAKPVAGPDQTLACANPATNTLTTSTTLAPSPAGGVFTQLGTTPAAATVNGNAVSGMSVAGTYQFVYTLNGCTDTVAVTVAPCQGCVKPNAGPDVAICAPTTTAKLTAVTAGGTWTPIASPANPSAASIDASGNVSGMTAVGTYRFVYSVTSGGQTCTDTASVVRNAKPVAGPDQTLACANPATNTLTTSTTLAPSPAGGVFTQLGTTPAAATVNGNSVSGMSVAGTYQFVYTLNGCTDTVAVTVQPCQGCVKPNAGPDVSICAPTTTAKLTAVTAGGAWSPHREPGQPLGGQHRRQRQRERDDGGGHLPLRLLGDQRRADLHRHGLGRPQRQAGGRPRPDPGLRQPDDQHPDDQHDAGSRLRRAASSPSWATSPPRPPSTATA